MAAAKPSKAAVANVVTALKAAGADAIEVTVRADGTFIAREVRVDPKPNPEPLIPTWEGTQG